MSVPVLFISLTLSAFSGVKLFASLFKLFWALFNWLIFWFVKLFASLFKLFPICLNPVFNPLFNPLFNPSKLVLTPGITPICLKKGSTFGFNLFLIWNHSHQYLFFWDIKYLILLILLDRFHKQDEFLHRELFDLIKLKEFGQLELS